MGLLPSEKFTSPLDLILIQLHEAELARKEFWLHASFQNILSTLLQFDQLQLSQIPHWTEGLCIQQIPTHARGFTHVILLDPHDTVLQLGVPTAPSRKPRFWKVFESWSRCHSWSETLAPMLGVSQTRGHTLMTIQDKEGPPRGGGRVGSWFLFVVCLLFWFLLSFGFPFGWCWG